MRIRTRTILRGLREIRTRSGSVDQADVPYMAYMKISCLEMEKARRDREKFSAETRIRNIDSRLKEIEAEKAALLVRLGERLPERSVGPNNSTDHSHPGATDPAEKVFRVRY